MDKIVLIEDDQALAENLEIILEAEGYKVFPAKTGKSGLRLIEEIGPDLIISDIMLPDIEGYDILKTVRESDLSDIPFVFLTARVDYKDLRQGMNLGADDYLTKPFNRNELIEVINLRIRLSKQRKLARETEKKTFSDKDKVFIKDLKGIISINLYDIILIKALGEYSEVYLKDGKIYTVRKIMKEWEELLPQQTYLRVHRSFIININSISKIENWFNHSFLIRLINYPEAVITSRRYSSKLKEMFFI